MHQGLQLWSVKEDIMKDAKATLKQLGSFGYKQVESFEGPNGIFWGMSNKDFKSYLADNGMVITSAHCDYTKNFEQKAAAAGEIGMKYLICPYLGPQSTLDAYKKAAEKFNECGDICKKHGLRFAYHNHDYSFKMLEGQLPQDVMMSVTNNDTVDYEMDMYWVVYAGIDPVAYLQKHPNRFRLAHIKDRTAQAATSGGEGSVDLGKGIIDFRKILADPAAKQLQHLFAEQEFFAGSTPMKSAEANAAYMASLNV